MTSFSKNPIMTTGISGISPKASDNREIFPCPVDQPQTHGYSQTQVSPGAHSSKPIVIDDDDDDDDYEFLQEGHHSPESRGIDFLVNSPKSMAENLRGSCRHIPHNGRPGPRWSSLGFGQDLRNYRHQPAQSSGNSPISNSIDTVQPPQQPNGQSTERMETTAPFDGLYDTTLAESARSHANVPDAQQTSDTHIPGVGRSETSDTSQRTVLGSLPLDYPLRESFIVDASAPASIQLPGLHNNPTEPVNFWSTGGSPGSLRRQKRQKAKLTPFRPSKLSRSHFVHAVEEPPDDHITSDSDFEAGYCSPKRQRKTLSSRRRSLQRKPESKSQESNSAAASTNPNQPLPLPFDSPHSEAYPLPDTKIICTESSGKTFFQLQFTWDGCHHTEDDRNEGGSRGIQRVSGHQEQRSRKGSRKPTSIDDGMFQLNYPTIHESS